jgi:PIN domain nuclease of toxin-antitoxin system
MIILDTHIWLWWVNTDTELAAARARQIELCNFVAVSAISCFEVSWLARHGRIVLP